MTTTTNQTPAQEQDIFILNFLSWLNANYVEVGDDEYLEVNSKPGPIKPVVRTAAECLELYRKIQIPPLPSASAELGPNAMAVLDETSRRMRIMFSGYQKLIHYLATAEECSPQEVKDIILKVLDQIS